MGKIRKLYYFDKKETEEMISFLNNRVNDKYINSTMFNPLLLFHHLLPLKLKFLPESFVLEEGKEIKGLITVAPTKSLEKKMEIQKLLFEENCFSHAAELVQYVVSKYKAKGATSIIVKVDDYLTELIEMFIFKCNFSQISSEKLWRINKFIDAPFKNEEFRAFRDADTKVISSIYNDSLLPHFRPLLYNEPFEYRENLCKGLSPYCEYKYIIQDLTSKKILGCVIIQTLDNENFIVDLIKSNWTNLDINSIISFAISQIRKRKNKFGLFIKTKQYIADNEKLEELFAQNGFECVQNQIILTNSSAKVLKDNSSERKYTILTDFMPNIPLPNQ